MFEQQLKFYFMLIVGILFQVGHHRTHPNLNL